MITEKIFSKEDYFYDFIDYLNKQFIGSYFFRGQSDAEWKNIESSLFRLIKFSKFNKEKYAMWLKELNMLSDLKSRIHLLTNEIKEEDDEYSKLSFLQHNGAPTKIIDVTNSPFIALYFSLAESPIVENSVVYAINSDNIFDINKEIIIKVMSYLNKKSFNIMFNEVESYFSEGNYIKVIESYNNYKEKKDNTIEIIDFYQPKIKNNRVIAQQGGFIIPSDPLTNIDNLLNEQYAKKKYDFIKIVYPREWCYDVYNYLKKHNITGETLFPGLEGFIRKKRQDIIFDYTMKI